MYLYTCIYIYIFIKIQIYRYHAVRYIIFRNMILEILKLFEVQKFKNLKVSKFVANFAIVRTDCCNMILFLFNQY